MSEVLAPQLALNNAPVSIPVVEDPQLTHDLVGISSPYYKYSRLTQDNNGATLPLGTSDIESNFEIPGSAVMNLSRSYITLDTIFTAPVAGAGNQNQVFTGQLPIANIKLSVDGGISLVDLPLAHVYSKVIQHMATPLSEYSTRGAVFGDTAAGTTYPISQCMGCQPCGVPLSSIPTTAQLPLGRPSSQVIIDVAAGGEAACVASALNNAGVNASATAASGSDAGSLSPQYVIAGADNAALFVRWKIYLGAFVGTILANDKDYYFGQPLQLTITWNRLSKWGYSASVAQGAGVELLLTSANNYYLYLCKESEVSNVKRIKAQVHSQGMQCLMPFTIAKKMTSIANTDASYMVNLAANSGLALKRCITVSINNADTLKRTANNFNVSQTKYASVRSYLGTDPLQDRPLGVDSGDVYDWLKPLLKGSPLGLSQRTLDQNACWVDNFSDCNQSIDFAKDDVKYSGLPVGDKLSYQIDLPLDGTTPYTAAQQLICYQTWVRKLIINPDGVRWGA